MISHRRVAASVILSVFIATAVGLPGTGGQPLKYGNDLIPHRRHMPLKGRAVGVLVADGQSVLATEGRSGPPDQLCFSAAGCSYRVVYVPVAANPQIVNLQVPVGDSGRVQVYPSLDMARSANVKSFGVEGKYTLVEVEVNNGQGSPKTDSFVATQIHVMEGSKEYPLSTQKGVAQMRTKFADYQKEHAKANDEAMDRAAKWALGDRKPTGPREKEELLYVTWMPDTERLRISFQVKLTDGDFQLVESPVRPGEGGKVPPMKGTIEGQPQGPARIRTGTGFALTFGVMYEIDKQGKLVGAEVAPFTRSTWQLPPPPRAGGPG